MCQDFKARASLWKQDTCVLARVRGFTAACPLMTDYRAETDNEGGVSDKKMLTQLFHLQVFQKEA